MATNSLKELETALVEKARILESVHARLAESQHCIIEADTKRLDEATHKAEEGFIRLNSFNKSFRTVLARNGEELGLSGEAQLTAIISASAPEVRSRLQELQKRCINIAVSISDLLTLNEALLRGSLEIVGNSLSLFAKFLGGEDTYGAAGRMANCGSAAGICREVKI